MQVSRSCLILEITFEDGTLGPGDKVVKVDGERIHFWRLAEMILEQDDIRGYEEMPRLDFINMINACMGMEKVTDEICNGFDVTEYEKDIARICVELYNNEEIIRPTSKGDRGGEYLRDFLNDCWCAHEVSEEILEGFHLKPIPY